ncbi:hypothetical protein CORC01_10767 [Colletotrichum orchidophilum]|uniref:Uncharacterized protein n=1 Tax=Colletotrichum orchidophilum TaxID=1209926 RepID=A0A1G4AXH8_9PEZI|nr:uncharacterized protein CORC01_10767 [Colletotrichum orchidophilum]OHE93868.1 hypothetical protein CORC01_10767 [Colletotrichum orchidophilum]
MKPLREHVWSELYNGAQVLPAGPKADKKWPPPNHGWCRHYPMSWMWMFHEIQDQIDYAIVPILTAIDNINAGLSKTTSWL